MDTEKGILASFDVKSLYTNIDTEFGVKAIEYWLEQFPQSVQGRFSSKFIVEALKLTLDNNICYFDGEYYRQISGTAMGTKVAPSYATLSLGYIEERMYEDIR